ncbi:MAG TPA: sulfatase-like hydrolase/transferase [Planctomycetota bacterium]|nr:sulfatase-like hydrolase/transferase [Planctomycetota bacterium]
MPDPSRELLYTPGVREREWNVLLVVIDDLRADHLSLYGYERQTSPLLDRRAASGTTFRSCHSPVGWTLPACASIITGQLPEDHGLYDHNQRFRKPKIGHYLGDRWYRMAVTNNGNVVSDEISREYLERLGLTRRPAKWRFFGWNDGFDRYEWIAREDHVRPFEIACEFLESAARGDGPNGDRPWFLFFHTNWVHDYHMDRPYYLDVEDWTGEPVHPALRGVRDGPEVWQKPPKGVDIGRVLTDMVAKYDAGIRTVDRKLDELLSRVDRERTIIIVMSDHGEGFDPGYGRVHHCGRLHSDLTHVPLILWLPPELEQRYAPPREVAEPCSTIDVVPTILTLLGDAVAGFPGRFLFDLSPHRRLTGHDRGYVYWNEDCIRESYDTARIEIRSELSFPLKEITVRKNDALKRYAYNLAYDPLEHDNLVSVPRPPLRTFEPISFVVAVNDEDELRHNLLASPVAQSPHHQWVLVENRENRRFSGISSLYHEALKEAEHDLVFFIHQDVFLPHGWEERVFAALAELESKDPSWGVVGAVGALPPRAGEPKELRGHWCDPSGYHRCGPLPHEVQSLDEQWLGIRRSSGIDFDSELPGFHCYGIDLSLTALELGRRTWALDAFVWHKYRDSRGYLVSRREDSPKIRARWTDSFMAEFMPSADYVERKWQKHLPFQTTSWNWDAR